MSTMPVVETRYDQLVRAGRDAREQADNVQWVEGDLALQVDALGANERPRDPETGAFLEDPDKALKRYAEDIEVPYGTLMRYRQVSEAWPTTRRLAVVSWTVHQALAAQDDRFDLIREGMTQAEARRLVRQRNAANYGGKPGWHELLGRVGDALTAADKHLKKFDDELTRQPNKALRTKAETYAARAEAIAAKLRDIANED